MTTIRDGVSSHDFTNALTMSPPMNEHHTDSTDHQHKHMEQPTVEDYLPDIDILEQLMSKTNLELAGINCSESLTAPPVVDFPSGIQSIPYRFFRDVPWNGLGSSNYTHPEARSKLHEAIELTAAGHPPKRSRKPSKRERTNIISETESTKSYVTAKTSSTATYFTASSTLEGSRNNGIDNRPALPQTAKKPSRSSWYDHLEGRGMIPNLFDEKNWSGRGQHAEFNPDEVDLVPLKAERILGTTANAVVESVMCRRIRLARKTIKCGRRMKREDAVTEVEHLQRLSHFHLIQVIGTYIMGKDLSILLYPATEYNLETFIDSIIEPKNSSDEVGDSALDHLSEASHWKCFHLLIFIGCLSNALWYLHANVTKHMDIKPKNLLVRQIAEDSIFLCTYQIYIADFGIARAYQSIADSETDSPTSCTRLYAAPEVIEGKRRGLSADIFSLGCVFLEILATIGWSLSGQDMLQELKYLRIKNINGCRSYQANIPDIQAWLSHFNDLVGKSQSRMPNITGIALPGLIQRMLEPNPFLRPSALDVAGLTSPLCCYRCETGPEKLKAV
jgi:Protein kinase domain